MLKEAGVDSVIDLGCGPGQFLRVLLDEPSFGRVAGTDVSTRALAQAARRLRLERMGDRQRERLTLFQGALTYEDPRFAGYDAAVLMEVIEHVDPPRLAALERVVFGAARPGLVVVTTPNVEYNALYEGLDGLRHTDHRFEWTRAEFAAWAERAAATYGYRVTIAASATPTPRYGHPDPAGGVPTVTELKIPSMGLVLLVGVSGSGKTTFAAQHFTPWQVVSSDYCRGLVADDPNDQSATKDAFDVLQYVVGTRLRRGLLTVVDATSVQKPARQALVRLAREHDVLVDAIVLDVPERVASERNAVRPDRQFGAHVVARQHRDLKKSLRGIRKEGFRRVHVLTGVDEVEAATITTERSWNDRRDLTGPFDIVGDVHGCASELRTLLTELGWQLAHDDAGRAVGASHPEGRTAVFVGDLVDRGPDTPGVLRLVMGMVAAGTALCVSGNHEAKLVRALKGANVRVSHGLAESLAQLGEETDEFRAEALAFMDGLISHYVLDDGRLVVAHAGLKEAYHGRSSGRVRVVRAVRRHHRRDRRVRPPGPLPLGPRLPRPGDGRLRPHPGARRPSGSTTRSASTPASSSAASSPRCATRSGRSSRSRPSSSGTSRCGRWSPGSREALEAASRTSTARCSHRRRRRRALARVAVRREGQGPGRERRRRARGDEPVRGRPALAGPPAADHVAGHLVASARGCSSTPTRPSTTTPRWA